MTAVADARVPARTRGSSKDLAGTGTLLRLALRRDRIMMPVWVLCLGLTASSTVGRLKGAYDTPEARSDLVADMNGNGSTRALFGAAFDDSLGALTVWRVGAFLSVFAAIMSLLIVIRHTREEEETGRQEALSACMVGRRAGLTSALLAVGIANAAVTVLIAGSLAGQGGTGALALGLAVGLSGMAFGGLAAVAAQLTENARLARGLTSAAVGVAFVLRMAGDAAEDGSRGSGHVLVWLSPLGWAEYARPFADERWWPLLLIAVLAAASTALAYSLAGRRDVGASFYATRPGPPAAGPSLNGVFGLGWRLHRGALLGWSAGFVFAGLIFGAISDGADDFLGDSDQTREIIQRMGGAQGLNDAFLASMVGILGTILTVYTASAVLRLRSEETDQRAEPLLSNAVSRLRWAGSHLVIAYLGPVVVLAIGGLALGVGYGVAADDMGGVPRAVGATLAQAPALWVVTSAAVFLVGVVPKYTSAAWAVVGWVVALGWMGPALKVSQSVMNTSPFSHLPKLPGDDVTAAPFLWSLLLSVVLTAGGLVGLRRRDIGG
ncbi:ABC transporter permease [Streptomyces sp. NEAU-Y11]|uniref:ABC transporter permease n=1 Tax=Streptomyces cucumeris TaxID=2962890 RepID=UPI0020C88790|nr:ABC transporter permease [Streptomyces sp. NEAU-Y11]MCP9209217.1 ABC transporter permease [Streptomyces sp. NEAU-Y11]